MHKFIVFGTICISSIASTLWGSGFQIPNQSVTAIGTAGSHIAYTPGPDAAYYNPANMSFSADSCQIEAGLTYLYLPSIKYSDNRSSLLDGSSDTEQFFLPLLHVSSQNHNNFRLGFSLTSPFGLAKSWQQPFPAAINEQFSLTVMEASPAVSYLIADNFSIGGGIRFIYGNGKVKSRATNPPFDQLTPITTLSRDVEGDDMEMGYHLATTYRPTEQLSLAATYKSKATLKLDGDALLTAMAGQYNLLTYQGGGSLEVNLPAVFSLASSYSFGDLIFEFTWNRTFWSSFEKLDFNYDQSLTGTIFDGYDRPVDKNWKDSDAFRVGANYRVSGKITTTLGFAYDKTPIPESTLGFELPGSDSFMYSTGVQYRPGDSLTIAASYMYQHTTSRTVTNTSVNGLPGIDGEFTDGGAHAVTIGLIYVF